MRHAAALCGTKYPVEPTQASSAKAAEGSLEGADCPGPPFRSAQVSAFRRGGARTDRHAKELGMVSMAGRAVGTPRQEQDKPQSWRADRLSRLEAIALCFSLGQSSKVCTRIAPGIFHSQAMDLGTIANVATALTLIAGVGFGLVEAQRSRRAARSSPPSPRFKRSSRPHG
mgnify:CR=1 FL=1